MGTYIAIIFISICVCVLLSLLVVKGDSFFQNKPSSPPPVKPNIPDSPDTWDYSRLVRFSLLLGGVLFLLFLGFMAFSYTLPCVCCLLLAICCCIAAALFSHMNSVTSTFETMLKNKTDHIKQQDQLISRYHQASRSDIEDCYEFVLRYLYPTQTKYITPAFWNTSGVIDHISARFELNQRFFKLERNLERYHDTLKTIQQHEDTYQYDAYSKTAFCNALINQLKVDDMGSNFDPSSASPAAARMCAELHTLYEESQQYLRDWGDSKQRREEIEKIRVIRKNAEEKIEQATLARYQLDYLLDLYPDLQDVLDTSHSELEQLKPIDQINHADDSSEEYDTVRNYLSETEYERLSTTEKNQLALDRYVNEHRKTKWQIGRDYELYIGYLCEKNGASVEYTGSLLKLEDLGRDLIAKYQNTTYIIQCKYWSTEKAIHEKHIMQLFGSAFEYRLSHPTEMVRSVFVTSTALSDVARKFADAFSDSMIVYENIPLGDFPRIKCNIGTEGKIYHLPMDLSYDKVKIDRPGEFLAFTVSEAENAGFRRSYKWHGSHE